MSHKEVTFVETYTSVSVTLINHSQVQCWIFDWQKDMNDILMIFQFCIPGVSNLFDTIHLIHLTYSSYLLPYLLPHPLPRYSFSQENLPPPSSAQCVSVCVQAM